MATRAVGLGRTGRTSGAEEVLNTPDNPFHATIGLRIQPATTGIAFRLAVDYQSVPLYVYRNIDEFATAMEQYVREAPQEGLYGWSVTDCEVTMFSSSYSVADGPPSRRGPTSTTADFRKLMPLVLMQARSPNTGPPSTPRPFAVMTSALTPTCRPRRCRNCIERCQRSRTATVCWRRPSLAISQYGANHRCGGVRLRIR